MNFQSLKNKKPDLLEIIDSVKPDIIMGTETWLDRNIVTVCVFVCHMFSYHSFYFDFHSARIIFDVSSGFYFWNVNRTPKNCKKCSMLLLKTQVPKTVNLPTEPYFL